jgi:hypothetical protein
MLTAALPHHRKLSDRKNQEQKYIMALGGHQIQIKCNSQPKKHGLNGKEMRHEVRPAGSTGGAQFGHFLLVDLGCCVKN